MLTVKQLFISDGLGVPEEKIKLVRHVGLSNRSIQQIVADGQFDFLQEEQYLKVRPFHNSEVILSFLGVDGNKAEFYGAYQVLGYRDYRRSEIRSLPDWLLEKHQDGKPRIKYQLQELTAYGCYRKRLIVQWKSTRGWHQKKDLDIYELLPPSLSQLFPGYQQILINFEDLKKIFADPRAHRDWQAALKANAGIYRIVDLSSGKIYIGSAYGAGGLWERWKVYAKTGHGGNKHLKGLDPSNFQWSVVRTVSTTLSPRDVIQIENLEKAKHGSRALGLNGN